MENIAWRSDSQFGQAPCTLYIVGYLSTLLSQIRMIGQSSIPINKQIWVYYTSREWTLIMNDIVIIEPFTQTALKKSLFQPPQIARCLGFSKNLLERSL